MCEQCKGTGKILLFNSWHNCDCNNGKYPNARSIKTLFGNMPYVKKFNNTKFGIVTDIYKPSIHNEAYYYKSKFMSIPSVSLMWYDHSDWSLLAKDWVEELIIGKCLAYHFQRSSQYYLIVPMPQLIEAKQQYMQMKDAWVDKTYISPKNRNSS